MQGMVTQLVQYKQLSPIERNYESSNALLPTRKFYSSVFIYNV